MKVRTGLEVLIEQKLDLVRGRRVGLVGNHSAVNRNLVHAVDVLRSAGVQVTALFGPEHGLRGDAPEGKAVASGTDARTGLPVHSLYGQTRRPTREMLAGVEVVLFDLQDVGCRFYTYIYTMAHVMHACAEYGKGSSCSIGRIPSMGWGSRGMWWTRGLRRSWGSTRSACGTG